MDKLDLRKQYKHLYQPSANKVQVVDVPALQFTLIDGEIEPGASPGTSIAFKQAMEAVYGISYSLKFMSKLRKENPIDYGVMALEALWWTETGEFDLTQPAGWKWTAMMMQPDHLTIDIYQEALAQVRKKRPNPALDLLRFESFSEGLCLQIMHIGPYRTEGVTIAKMDAFAAENGYRMRGKHHEIYLGNPMLAAEDKLKTILRHPVAR
ncbi:MAG: hypothetical protein A2W35_13775 [Chloroflexi bacterium RBG_16_57_11]|nr:MAG: hypothetical protein A2W35_13775 [Chloroflexi bacterium RBG_16_57_11]